MTLDFKFGLSPQVSWTKQKSNKQKGARHNLFAGPIGLIYSPVHTKTKKKKNKPIHQVNPHSTTHIPKKQWPLLGHQRRVPRPCQAVCPVFFVMTRGYQKGTSPWCWFAATKAARRRGCWCASRISRSHAWLRCWRWPRSSLGTASKGC